MRIYTDESRTKDDQGPYMVIGGIVCNKETAKEIRRKIQELRNQQHLPPTFEFHFSQIQPDYIEVYKKLIDIFVEFYSQKCQRKQGIETKEYPKRLFRRVCFEAILIEHSKVNHDRFSNGDPELGFFRFYYTLLAHTIQKYFVEDEPFHITIDDIRTSNRRMVPMLHSRLVAIGLHPSPNPNNVMRQNSKSEYLLQIADVILGAVSFSWNIDANVRSTNANAKREVVQYAEETLSTSFLKTTFPAKSFNIWKLDLQ